jgi:hypothetical protein
MSLASAMQPFKGFGGELTQEEPRWGQLSRWAQKGWCAFVVRRSDRPNEGPKRLARSEIAYLNEPTAAEVVAGILVSKHNVVFSDVRVVHFLNHTITGPKTTKKVDRVVQLMESLGDDFPGTRSRNEWMDEFGIGHGSYYRALARLGKPRKYRKALKRLANPESTRIRKAK